MKGAALRGAKGAARGAGKRGRDAALTEEGAGRWTALELGRETRQAGPGLEAGGDGREPRLAPEAGRAGPRFRLGRNGRGFAAALAGLVVTGLIVLYAASFYNAQDTQAGQFAELYSQLAGVGLGQAAQIAPTPVDLKLR